MNRHGQHGYAMAALIVAMSVMAILLTAAMPVWRQTIRREKETELEFRLGQYARALALYQKKAGPGVTPPNLDVLIDQKYLRKKYKDPITGEDFEILRVGSTETQAGQQQGFETGARPPGQGQSGQAVGGIMGVVSKSTETSLKVFNGRTRYNEWQSTMIVIQSLTAGGGANGVTGVGGGVGGGANGRGNPSGVGGVGRGNNGRGTGGQGGFGNGQRGSGGNQQPSGRGGNFGTGQGGFGTGGRGR